MYSAKIVKDSYILGCRLTTFEVTYPLIIHAEMMTHRMFSRNVASNRAIPVKKMLDAVRENPFVPERFPVNKAGMQSEEWFEGKDDEAVRHVWMKARNAALHTATSLAGFGVHKQIANRLLAPFLWTTAVITATDWGNFFNLRCSPMAQPEMQKIAQMMSDLYYKHDYNFVIGGSVHLPYVTEEELDDFGIDFCIMMAVGRCARVSYLNQGTETNPTDDVKLARKLWNNGHLSPFEHVAYAMGDNKYYANFRGWQSCRNRNGK